MAGIAAAGAGDAIFYPLLLIAEQALRDASGNLSLETFWQVIDSKRFIGAAQYLTDCGVRYPWLSGARQRAGADSGVYSVPGSQLVGRVVILYCAADLSYHSRVHLYLRLGGLLNGTLMALFAFELPPVDFLYSINGVILAEITVFTPLVMRPLMAGLRQIDKSQLEAASILGAHPLRVITVIFRQRSRR